LSLYRGRDDVAGFGERPEDFRGEVEVCKTYIIQDVILFTIAGNGLLKALHYTPNVSNAISVENSCYLCFMPIKCHHLEKMAREVFMSQISVQVSQGGRIVIPAEMRLKMGVNIGDKVLLSWSDDAQELRIATRKQRLQNALSLVQRYATPSASVVDSLIRERREAALDE